MDKKEEEKKRKNEETERRKKKCKGRKGNGRELKSKDTIGSAIYHCPYSLLLPKFKEWPV